jgi:CubicO group peptidase (beta-lactamase class C family)
MNKVSEFCMKSSSHLSPKTGMANLLAIALLISLACPPAAVSKMMRESPARLSDARIIDDLKAHLQDLAADDEFSGAVLLAKDGKILFEQAYGDADKSFNVPNSIDTKFNLGSMGKMFTAVAVLQLAQDHKLSLEDKLIKDLPDYPNRQVANEVTIGELLTHTAGLGDFFGPEFLNTSKDKFDTLESLLPLFVNKPLLFAPGHGWQYSNAGFIVLGLVIQHVSGETYYDYVQKHVFERAGMKDTGNWPADAVVANRAVGYTRVGEPEGALRKSNVFELQRGGSAGGGYSTVGDLFRFAEALQSYRLLDKKYTRMIMEGHVETGRPGVRYGYGMEESYINGVRIVGHGGGGPGIQCMLDMYPGLGYVVAIMTNYDDAMARADGRLRVELSGQRIPPAVPLSAAAILEYAGQYQPLLPPGAHMMGTPPPIEVKAGTGELQVNPGMGPSLDFEPMSKDEFFEKDNPAVRIEFVRGAGGKVVELSTKTGFGPVPPVTAKRSPH